MGRPRRLGRRADAKPLVSCSEKLGAGARVATAKLNPETANTAFKFIDTRPIKMLSVTRGGRVPEAQEIVHTKLRFALVV